MIDITSQMLHYRECLRVVWNSFFVNNVSDAWDPFMEAETLLLELLVFGELPRAAAVKSGSYYSALQLDVKEEALTLDPMYYLRPVSEQTNSVEILTSLVDIELRFADFYDWSVNELRDFRYAQGIVVNSRRADIAINTSVLIPALDTRFQIIPVDL